MQDSARVFLYVAIKVLHIRVIHGIAGGESFSGLNEVTGLPASRLAVIHIRTKNANANINLRFLKSSFKALSQLKCVSSTSFFFKRRKLEAVD